MFWVCNSSYQSTLDAVYVHVVPWSEFPIVPSYPHICSAMVGVPHRHFVPSLPTASLYPSRLTLHFTFEWACGHACEVSLDVSFLGAI